MRRHSRRAIGRRNLRDTPADDLRLLKFVPRGFDFP
jgi:hypothetical protein